MPRSDQAEWIDAIGVKLAPAEQAVREYLLSQCALHADEIPAAMAQAREPE